MALALDPDAACLQVEIAQFHVYQLRQSQARIDKRPDDHGVAKPHQRILVGNLRQGIPRSTQVQGANVLLRFRWARELVGTCHVLFGYCPLEEGPDAPAIGVDRVGA